jgi:hypothetical protein
MDAWWPHLVRGMMEPFLGQVLLDRAAARQSSLPTPNVHASDRSGWAGFLAKQLRVALGQSVQRSPSRLYCGPTRDACRVRIQEALRAALADATSKGLADFEHDRVPFMHNEYQISFPSAGVAPPVAPVPWQNRPTFEMISSYR